MPAAAAATLLRQVLFRRRRVWAVGRVIVQICAIAMVAGGLYALLNWNDISRGDRFIGPFFIMSGLLSWSTFKIGIDPFFKNLIEALARIDDPVGACVLLELALDGGLRRIATEPASKALSLIKTSDYSRVDDQHRALFNRAVLCKDLDLVRSTLRALEQIGDDSALQSLYRLASGDGLAGQLPDLARDARSCIEAIELAEQTRKHARVLLRPSQAPATESILLRPAGLSTGDPANLLRPTESADRAR